MAPAGAPRTHQHAHIGCRRPASGTTGRPAWRQWVCDSGIGLLSVYRCPARVDEHPVACEASAVCGRRPGAAARHASRTAQRPCPLEPTRPSRAVSRRASKSTCAQRRSSTARASIFSVPPARRRDAAVRSPLCPTTGRTANQTTPAIENRHSFSFRKRRKAPATIRRGLTENGRPPPSGDGLTHQEGVARGASGPVLTPPKHPDQRGFRAQESHLHVTPLSHNCSISGSRYPREGSRHRRWCRLYCSVVP